LTLKNKAFTLKVMDAIDIQIKALLRKKAKKALLESLSAKLEELPEDLEHEGLKAEVTTLVATFLLKQINEISHGNVEGPISPPITPKQEQQVNPEEKPQIKHNAADLKTFLKQYGHLGFKRVVAKNPDNNAEVKGKVIKNDYPRLLIDDEISGQLISVNPETVKEI
jgi:hypothetical protein